MKLFFTKEDSLYKIFKTLEKIPDHKTININIENQHAFFDNERRGKQIKELLEKKHINAFFETKTEKAKYFFGHLGLKVIHQEKHQIVKFFNIIYLFLFNIKKFHLQIYSKKNYIFYATFFFEAIFILLIIYGLYSLVLPSANIKIIPSNQIENIIYNFRYYPGTNTEYPKSSRFLSIPFKSEFIDFKYNFSINTANIKYMQNPSEGKVEIINQTEKEYSFLPNTKFITDDGRLFISKELFKLPAAVGKEYGKVTINLKATEQDIQGTLMGPRGNLIKGTKLYIKNLKNSYYGQSIYAQVISNFTGGTLYSNGVITQKDIDSLSGKLTQEINKQKSDIITKNFQFTDSFFLNFERFINIEIQQIFIKNKIGEKTPTMQGYIIAHISFITINQSDLIDVINKYIKQRPSDKIKLITIDKNSISFLNNIKENEGVFIIPTKVSIIQAYDFTKDINGILPSIKEHIISLDKEKAKEIITAYPEISNAIIGITPPRYNSIPKIKSRINISIKN
ncbi:MAG: hypothetical protein WC872_02660 [Candidatus Absconditabacterales bacterium]